MEKDTIKLAKIKINGHGHARGMNQEHKMTVEQYLRESQSAGIGISILMPNTDPPITNMETLERYINLIENARKKLSIQERQYVYFGITDDNLNECEEALQHPLVIGLKDYPKAKDGKTVTTGTIGVTCRSTREAGVRLTAAYNKVYARHCANPAIFAKSGRDTIRGEEFDVVDTIEIARSCPWAKILICHVSNSRCAKRILNAQKKGLQIAIEICIQYLWFDSNGTNWIPGIDPVFYHCFNNLRPREHRLYLRDLITKENPLVFLSTDSAPHLEREKMANKKLGGIPSHQELVPVAITLAKQLGISDQQVANLLSFNASKFFNIPVPEELVEYEIEEKTDNLQYNHGKVLNPWNGSKLWFPKRKEQ